LAHRYFNCLFDGDFGLLCDGLAKSKRKFEISISACELGFFNGRSKKMGLSGVSMGSLILIFLIAVLLFGTDKLKDLGSDLGKAIKGFKKALDDEPS
jgi:sec-independent protein translocase protein TatA